MRTIRMMLVDEAGSVISGSERDYPLEGSCQTIHAIEGAVEKMARQALPALEHVLLCESEAAWASEVKKGDCAVKVAKKHR